MRTIRTWLSRFGGLFNKQRRDSELAAELESHLQMHIEDNLRSGINPDEARRRALIKLGGVDQAKEKYRDRRGVPWLEALFRDLRYALRTLRKNPGFTAVAILTLALGIGANAAIFSVVNQVLLNPAGVLDPQRVVAVRARYNKLALRDIPVSVPDFDDVRKNTQVFEATAIVSIVAYNYTSGGAAAEVLPVAAVSEQWFRVFGAKPLLGRGFQPEEDKPNANQVVVLSFAAWTRLFGRDAGILGKAIELNQTPYRVVGVMGPEFRWPADVDVDLWIPLGLADSAYNPQNRFNESYTAVARLKPGVEFKQANAFVQVLADRVKNEGTQRAAYAKNVDWGLFIVPFTDFIAGDTKTPMLVLLGAVGFVLLIACSNIAGLLLARTSGRGREIAIRTALGAGRWDLVRQSFVESLVLAFAGAVVGLGLAYAGARGLLALAPKNGLVPFTVRIDSTVLLFTVIATVIAGILFGVAPAWRAVHHDRFESLNEGGRSGSSGVAHQRLRASLIIAEVAIALVLLAGAGLFLRSLARLEGVNPGFQPAGVITATIALPAATPSQPTEPAIYADSARRLAFYRAVLDHLSHLPGVTKAAAGFTIPFFGGDNAGSFEVEGHPLTPGEPGAHGDLSYVTPDYFSTLQIPLRSGREFIEQDQEGSAPVAIIDETLAQQYWPNENPIGKRIRRNAGPWVSVVGLVGHVKHSDLAGDTEKGRYYFPMYQSPLPFATFVVRTPSDPARLANSIGEAVQDVDSTQGVSQVKTLSDMVGRSLAPRRFVVTLLGVFAGMALLMAVLGLYGVISYSVSQRTREIGIRVALGAQRGRVQRMVIGQGMRLVGIGAALGLAASVIFSRLLKSQLFQVSTFDPLTFAVTAVILLIAALFACYIPARRAMRVDPAEALRHE